MRIFLNSPSFVAGETLKGHIELDTSLSRDIKYLDLKLSCFFCGGTLVSPTMNVKRMIISSINPSGLTTIDFEYSLPSSIPSSNPKIVNGVDLGVQYVFTAKLGRGLFHRNLSRSVPVTVTRKDSGAGLKVKFVKFGGPSFNHLVQTIQRNYPISQSADVSNKLAPAVSCC